MKGPHTFVRYAPAICAIHVGLALVAAQFAAVVLHGGSPITPELYGPAVYAMPAIAWSAAQVGSAAIAALGAFISGRFGAVLVIIGASAGFVIYSMLAVLAQMASQGTIVQAACIYICSPASLASVWFAARYLHVRR